MTHGTLNIYIYDTQHHVSSVKQGHLSHFDPTPTNTFSPTNPMGSSGPLWARLYNNNYKNQK